MMFQLFAVITERIDIATFIQSEVYSASFYCNYIRYSMNVNRGFVTNRILKVKTVIVSLYLTN